MTLLARETPHGGDSPEMVAARERFLGAGHYEPIAAELAELCAEAGVPDGGCVLELGAGTAYYLAAVLERLGGRAGIAVELSRAATQRAARATGRIGAVRADVWAGLPVRDGSVALALSVFGPRNGAELARVVAPGGLLAVVTPLPGHLAEIAEPMGLLGIEKDKQDRLAESLGPEFNLVQRRRLEVALSLSRGETLDLASMGPTARHHDLEELRSGAKRLQDPSTVSAVVELSLYRR